jgi:hypothetical protein
MDRGLQPTFTDPINKVFNATSDQPQYEGQINYTHLFSPSLVNQFIVSGSWYSAIFGNESTKAQSVFPGALYDFDTSSWTNLGGTNNAFPQGRKVTQYQFVDDLSWTHNTHTLKFGGNFRRNDVSDFSNLIRTVPRLRSFSLTDLAEGTLDQISQRFPQRTSNPIAIYSFGLYIQDEWRARNNLKFTAALRVDRNSNTVCQTDCFARFPNSFDAITHDDSVPFNQLFISNLHSAFPEVEKVVVQPRLGFAWQPKGSTHTVIRGGAGLFSDLYPATLVDNFMHNAPQLRQFTLARLPFSPDEPGNAYASEQGCDSIFLNTFNSGGTLADYQAAGAAAGLGCRVPDYNSVANHVTNPKFVEWNLEVQHSIGTRTVFSANYVGNYGYDLFVTNPWVNAGAGGFGTFAGLPDVAPDSRVGNVSNLVNSGKSNYNGLTVSVARQLSRGFSGRVNYTFSHALDDVSNGGVLPYSLNDSIALQLDPTSLRRLNYSNADYDVRHLVSANYVWDLPFKPANALWNTIIGGWTVSGTFFYRTGLPFSVIDGSAPAALRNGVNGVMLVDPITFVPRDCTSPSKQCFMPDQFTPLGGETGFAHTPRNSFRGPGYFNSDFSLLKAFKLTERLHLSAGANFYNVFNHPNFANPINDISSGQFGTIQSTVVPPTSPYGAFVSSAVSGRLIQLTTRLTF